MLGKVFAKWDGADKFKNTMRKHGAALIDKVGDRLMKVAPAGGSEATVKAFVDGM